MLRVEESAFDSVLKICDFISHKVVNKKIVMYILKENWKSFIAECKLNNIEIETSKLFSKIGISRENVVFVRIGKMNIHAFTKILAQFRYKVKLSSVGMYHTTVRFPQLLTANISESTD